MSDENTLGAESERRNEKKTKTNEWVSGRASCERVSGWDVWENIFVEKLSRSIFKHIAGAVENEWHIGKM